MTGEILTWVGEHIGSIKLIPGPHGRFDVRGEGDLIGERTHGPIDARYFPEALEGLRELNEYVAGEPLELPSAADHGHRH
jgi:predicted Rdx family selenoprotein